MLKKAANSLPLIFLVLMASALLIFPDATFSGAENGLRICARAIIPSLFPFFVVINLMCSLGYTEKIGASCLLLGLIGGYPVGAQTIANQYRNGIIGKGEAQQMILYCNNAGPAFIFGVVGYGVFQSFWVGLALYLIHAVSAVILGATFIHKKKSKIHSMTEGSLTPRFSNALTVSVRQAGLTAIQVCIFVIFFSVLCSYFQFFIPEQWKKNPFVVLGLSCLELAGGISMLSEIPNQAVLFCLSSFLLGFGGLCVTFQTFSILDEAGLSGKHYLASKLFHGLISILLAVPVSSILNLSGQIQMDRYSPLLPIIPAAWFLLMGFLKKSSGNTPCNGV